MCTDEEEEADDGAAGRTRAQKQSRISKSAVAPPSERINHVLVQGTSIGVGGKRKAGSCNMCKEHHASGVCFTFTTGQDINDPKPFRLFDWHSQTPMPLPIFARDVESPKVEYNTFVISPHVESLSIDQFLFLDMDRKT